MMSARKSAGSWREGTPAVAVYLVPRARLLHRLGQQVDLAPDQLGQAPLQGLEREKPNAGFRVQLGGEVHVTAGLVIAASEGAEQRQVADAGAAEFRLMLAQDGNHMVRRVGCGWHAHRGVTSR